MLAFFARPLDKYPHSPMKIFKLGGAMKVKTLTAIPSAKGIIPAGLIIEITASVRVKLQGKVVEITPVVEDEAIIDPVVSVKTIWPPEVQSLVNWFSTTELPTEPFHFPKVGKVIDPVKYFAQLRIEIEIGPRGPRARMGTLQSDLRKLKDYLESESS